MKPILIFLLILPFAVIGMLLFIVLWFSHKFKCPACGSRKHTRVSKPGGNDNVDPLFEWKDFKCKACSHQYAVKPPKIFKGLPILIGISFIVIGIDVYMSPSLELTIVGHSLFIVGPALIIYGIIKLFKKKKEASI